MADEITEGIPGYRFIAKIGEGGMSTVWKAKDLVYGTIVAIKMLNREYCNDDEEIRAFRSEAQLMKEINHPGVTKAYDFDEYRGHWYMVMEFVNGYTFADLLRRKRFIRESDCLLICESVSSALDSAWNDHGIVHCDIKPENIMINTDGIVKLTDLGISNRFHVTADGAQEVPDHVLGTPAYISPEQVYGDVVLDCRSDIYSLAATLYHLSTGQILFPMLDNETTMRAQCDETAQARDPREFRPELSEGFVQMLEAMLVKNRDYRVASWAAVFQMCRDIEAGIAFKPRDNTAVSSIVLTVA